MTDDAIKFVDANGFGVVFGETIGIDPFEQPGGSPPIGGSGFSQSAQGFELRTQLGLAKGIVKIFVAQRFATNGPCRATDVASRVGDAASGREERRNFTSFDFVQRARAPHFRHRGYFWESGKWKAESFFFTP